MTRRKRGAGFTLVEVILAISIATGLLIVALTFYRQVTDLRAQILQESERLSTVRLLLDRVAGDLRTARVGVVAGQEFRGDASSLSFVTASVALPKPGHNPGTIVGGADGARISVGMVTASQGTNISVLGIVRQEEPLDNATAPEAAPISLSRMGVLAPDSIRRSVEPTTEVIRYLRFRYWNGVAWQSGWTNSAPPPGVEIVLGVDPQPEDGSAEEYPFEQFRRVVYVPAGEARPTAGGEATGDLLVP